MKKTQLLLFAFFFSISTIYAQRKMTSFQPQKYGFKFGNTFKASLGDPGSIKADWGGLCGGMTFSAADYFYKSVSTPTQTYTPPKLSPLYKHLFSRQQNAIWQASIDKVAENWFNPFGRRNEEFWGWAVDERLKELKGFIDRNRPIPILLFNGRNNDVAKNHWVLAIGYDLGGYRFQKKNDPRVENVKIFVYDPNYPNKICVLIPKKGGDWLLDYSEWNPVTNRKGRTLDRSNRKWRHYYVYNQFQAKTPPTIRPETSTASNDVYKLVAQFRTGNDDLRGGNDNVNILVEYKDGSTQTFRNVNRGQRWADHSTNNVELRLKKGIKTNHLRCIRILTTFGGGMGGDNWNLDQLTVTAYQKNSQVKTIKTVSGQPWKRFTGDRKNATVFF